jgi:hypothetical protein
MNYDDAKDEIIRLLKPKMHLEQKLGLFFAVALVAGVIALEINAPKPVKYMDPLKPSAGLLCKIVSAVVHADEMREPGAHHFDKIALDKVLDDPEVKEWVEAMTVGGFAPVKRSRPATEKLPEKLSPFLMEHHSEDAKKLIAHEEQKNKRAKK